jgi:WD40 repeat protein
VTGERVGEYTGHDNTLYDLELLPGGKTIAVAGDSGHLITWDVETSELLGNIEVDVDPLHSLEITADGGRAITSGDSGAIEIFDLETMRRVLVLADDIGWTGALALSPSGRSLASAGSRREIRIWDAEPNGRVMDQAHEAQRRRGEFRELLDGWQRQADGAPDVVLALRDRYLRDLSARDASLLRAEVLAFLVGKEELPSPDGEVQP